MNTKYYKHPKYGTVYGNAIVTPTGRCAWPALVKPQEAPPAKPGEPQGAPRYGVTIILPKADKAAQEWVKAVSIMVKEMLVSFNEGRKAKLSLDSVLLDGDGFDLEKYPYYKDSWILTARNVKLPNIVDGKKSELPADAIMGGMFVRATVTPLLTGHGVSYKLEALQRVRDDSTRFAGASRAGGYLDMIPIVADEGEAQATSDETPLAAAPATDAPKNGKAKALAML
jgi:hypothetical protein